MQLQKSLHSLHSTDIVISGSGWGGCGRVFSSDQPIACLMICRATYILAEQARVAGVRVLGVPVGLGFRALRVKHLAARDRGGGAGGELDARAERAGRV